MRARTLDYPPRSPARASRPGSARARRRRPRPGRPGRRSSRCRGARCTRRRSRCVDGGAAARLRGPRPRPELRRAAGGDHPALPRPGLRLPRPRGLGHHPRRRAGCPGGAGATSCAGSSGARGRAPSSGPSCATCATWSSASPPEREADGLGGLWTPQRLKNTLSRHLHGERVVIVANREPYIHERTSDGEVSVVHPASGLVTALEPVMRACSGVWVAHGSGSADRETSDENGRLRVPPGRGVLRPAAGVALARGGEGLLLRLLQRGPLAAVPHRPHPARLPQRGLAPLPGGQPEVRRRGLRGGGLRRPDHPRPGLPLRAPARG